MFVTEQRSQWRKAVVALCVAAHGCGVRGSSTDASAPRPDLRRLVDTSEMLARYYEASDFAGMHALLASGVEVVLPSGDTLRGKERVAEAGPFHRESSASARFVRGELWNCAGGPQEYGLFEVRHPQTGATHTGGYQVHWQADADGWRVHRIALTLPRDFDEVRRRSCPGAQEVAFRARRLSILAYPPWTSGSVQPPRDDIVAAVRAAGWADQRDAAAQSPLRLQDYDVSRSLAVEIGYRWTDHLSVQAFVARPISGLITGEHDNWPALLEYRIATAGATVGYHVSVLRVEAGVTVADSDWVWRSQPYWQEGPLAWSGRTLGLTLGSTVTLPVADRLAASLAVQHRYSPMPDLREYRSAPGAPMRLTYTHVMLGIGVRH